MYFTCGSLSIWTVFGLKMFVHSRVFARLAMRQTRVFGVGITNVAHEVFKNASFGTPPKSTQTCFTCKTLSICTVLRFRFEILAHINFVFSRKFSRV